MRRSWEPEIQAGMRYLSRTDVRSEKLSQIARKSNAVLEVESQERVATRYRRFGKLGDLFGYERLMGRSQLVPANYVERGLDAMRPVVRLNLGKSFGCGFLVSPRLMLTTHRTLPNLESAQGTKAEFGFVDDPDGKPRRSTIFALAPDAFFFTDPEMDFTLVALAEMDETRRMAPRDFGYLQLSADFGKALLTERLTAILHPSGSPKHLSLREHELVDVFDHYIHYRADAELHCFGGPILNDQWEAVAMHHAGIPDLRGRTPEDASSLSWVGGEGVLVCSIRRKLETISKELDNGLLDQLLWGPDPGTDPTNTFEADLVRNLTSELNEELDQKPAAKREVSGAEKLLERWARWEEKTTDSADYADRAGYDPAFLGDEFAVFLPLIDPQFTHDIARTAEGDPELRYHHFSVVMCKSRRLAYLTAANVDGENWRKVKRTKNTWLVDPRIPASQQTANAHYQHRLLDRTSLVRRQEAAWEPNSELGAMDSLHLTTCVPTHSSMGMESWLELEREICKVAVAQKKKVTVFSGPVLRADDPEFEDLGIPTELWKVVVTVHEDELCVGAFLLTNRDYSGSLEFPYGEFRAVQTSVQHLESLCGLDFGRLRRLDPRFGLPLAEQMRPLVSWEDAEIPGLTGL